MKDGFYDKIAFIYTSDEYYIIMFCYFWKRANAFKIDNEQSLYKLIKFELMK